MTLKVLLISSQPIQNAASLQAMARDTRAEVLTAYCTLPDPKLWTGAENLTKEVFDLPMFDGYAWKHIRNYSPKPRLGKFYGLFNPGVIKLVASSDCSIVYGHAYLTFWLAICTAKLLGKPVILGTDATYIDPHNEGRQWKASLKRKIFPFLYNRVSDLVFVPSTASKRFLLSLGVKEERIALTPYVVDNDVIAAASARSDKQAVRQEWQVPQDATVAIFVAKFLPRKRPQDALEAFAQANVENSYLVMVGDGPLGDSLRNQALKLGVADKVRFTGLIKYSRLADFYTASDLLLFTSEHEPYGLPVNEAMICGIPAVVSNRIGAGYDLVEEGKTGCVYPSGDVAALTKILRKLLLDRALLKEMGCAAKARMETWSPSANAFATISAVEKAIARRIRNKRSAQSTGASETT